MKNTPFFTFDKKTFLQNQSLKDSLSSLNFTAIQHIMISLQLHQKEQNEKYNFQSSQAFLTTTSNTLKSNLFHLKGRLHSLKIKFDKSNISNDFYFNCDLIIRDELCEYQLKAYHIRKTLSDKFQKMQKSDSILYLTNLRCSIDNKESSRSTQLIFSTTLKTKIYSESKSLYDTNNYTFNNCPHVFNSSSSGKNDNKLRLDLTVNNELEFIETIDNNQLDKIIKKLQLKTLDIAALMTIPMKSMTVSITTGLESLASNKGIVNAIGFISQITINKKLCIIELFSLIDLTQIKVHIYEDLLSICDLEPRMVVLFNQYNHKLNKKLDIILCNRFSSSHQVVGKITENEYDHIMKNRYKYKKIDFSTIISLVTNTVIRDVRKYMITIKKIFKLRGNIEKNWNKIPGYPDLKLYGKFLIDDGTCEATAICYDLYLVRMLNLTPDCLDKMIERISLGNGSELLLYDQNERNNVITWETIDELLYKQFIIFATPYVNTFDKMKTDIMQYIQQLESDKDDLNKLKNNSLFINGDIIIEKNNDLKDRKDALACRPCLLIISIEVIDD